MAGCDPDIQGDHIAMAETPDPQTQRRLADNLKSALVDFFVAANSGTASVAQREALTMALEKADALPDDVRSAAVNETRREAELPP
ncbi:MAG: hypothetical protein WBW74_13860 [Xanthobacteraceae bacterium]